MVGLVTGFVRIAVWVVVTGIWAVVGVFFWIPFLARMIATYTGAILVATYTGAGHGAAEHGLRTAIELYPRGFQRINHLLRTDAEMDPALSSAINLAGVVRFLLEAAFAGVFWGATMYGAVNYAGFFRGSAIAELMGARATATRAPAPLTPVAPVESSMPAPAGKGPRKKADVPARTR